jgi:hypothetical protein
VIAEPPAPCDDDPKEATMTAKPSLFTRIRHAVFGKPLSHEEAQARHEAQVAAARCAGEANNRSGARSVQNQTYYF